MNFKNYEALAHHWVQDSTENNRVYSDRMLSYGNKIYSYGTHYCIAQKVRDNNGEEVYLLNPETYSSTTTKHRSVVLKAIPSYATTIYVPDAGLNYEKTMEYYIELIADNLDLASRARQRKDNYLFNVARYTETAKDFHARFGKRPLSNSELEILTTLDDPKEIYLRIATIAKAKEEAAKAKLLKDNKDKINKEKKALKLWLKGEGNQRFYWLTETYLRFDEKNQMVETSRYATMAVDKARILFYLIKRKEIIESREYEGWRIAWNDNRLQIGCHSIGIKEINRFAKQMGWN